MRAAGFAVAPNGAHSLRGRDPGSTGGFLAKEESRYLPPVGQKWFTQLAAASILLERLDERKLRYPEPEAEIEAEGIKAKEI
ncbi:hypothetical protein MAMC_01690 [Methylacidimicrobium cyclopophantes]|uniref:Uncharacterized protein n=1 Tax=Methylacidimicrobium cyclopophantes TaxID=1041766 RepID=A0A5E6MGQ8_9BACT|nr:hypothetical protein [Methylacidimicrobium cyclopophantes]VVM07552.1 hypothetical protein MAMC_01690 [Methylacidimicrobium cyclopophantes]